MQLKAEIESNEEAAQIGMVSLPEGGYIRDPNFKPLDCTPEVVLGEHEIRRRLETRPVHETQHRYLQAVADGSDPLFVSAVEHAPIAFPVVSEETLSLARELRISRAPLGPAIYQKRALFRAHAFLAEMAHSELYADFPAAMEERTARSLGTLPELKAVPRVPLTYEKLFNLPAVEASA